jgi:predicted Zn-dependent peptidase
MTAYYFSCTEGFEDCLRILLEFVSTPYFTGESVTKEFGIIDQEIGMTEDAPDNRVYENLMGAAFSAHPIRVPILGTRETIREITPEILTTCHRAFYTPGNMLLCVVGDVEPDTITAIAREVLGDESREVGRKIRGWNEPESCAVSQVEGSMEVAMPMFSMLFKCPYPGKGEEGIRREILAELACEILFGESSELYQKLYEEGIIDTSFGGGFEVIDGCAMLMISGDSDEPEAVRRAVIAQAKKLAGEGVAQSDYARMLRCALGSRIKGLDNFDSTCFRLCAYHMTEFDYFDFPRIYESITVEEIRSFLAEFVREDNCALSVIYPNQQEETL